MFGKECVMNTALPKFKSYFYQILEILAGFSRKVIAKCNHMFLFAFTNKNICSQNNQ